jgi:hypothetical protein
MHTIGILGSGDWSQKLIASLEARYSVRAYSSRAVKNRTQTIDASLNAIWIASRNSQQLELAELLLQSDFEGKLILEKPYFTNIEERDSLLELIESNEDRIYLSRVWAKSRIWKEFLRTISVIGLNFEVSAFRVGTKRRSEFLPPLDWLPHDLYLASDLSIHLNREIEVITSLWESDDILTGTMMIGTDCKFDLVAGFGTERKNSWTVIYANGDSVELDFVARSIKLNENFIYQESEQNLHDVPILNYADWVINQSHDLQQQRIIDLNSLFLLQAEQI